MKRIVTKIYFVREFAKPQHITSVICEEPYKEVKVEGEDIDLPEEYRAEILGKVKILNKQKDPVDYTLFLYQYFHGDYMWAELPEEE